jgi:2-iminobutanoate/2-iminopropanoate deaminase
MPKMEEIRTEKSPKAVGPYSQGIKTEKFVFVSGQLPVNPETGNLVEKDISTQTDRVIENIKAILDEAGLSLNDVVRCEVFLKDMNDFKEMNDVYSSKFASDIKPARQAFQVGKLPMDALVEISCIAAK